jgi:hypothetical protein
MSGRITARVVTTTKARLTDTDRLLIGHLATVRQLSGRQIRDLVDAQTESPQRSIRRQLVRLTELRVIARLGRRIGGQKAGSDGFVYSLDVLGQRLVNDGPQRRWRRPWTPSPRVFDHHQAVSQVYVDLAVAARRGDLELISFRGEPRCWRSFVGPGGGRLHLKPDAQVVVADGEFEHHLWIELDRATESLPWIAEKAKAYERYFRTGREQERTGVFPRCLWLTTTPKRMDALITTLGRLPQEQWQLHQVALASDVVQAVVRSTSEADAS